MEKTKKEVNRLTKIIVGAVLTTTAFSTVGCDYMISYSTYPRYPSTYYYRRSPIICYPNSRYYYHKYRTFPHNYGFGRHYGLGLRIIIPPYRDHRRLFNHRPNQHRR